MSAFHLPDVGEGLQDAEIVAWHVGPGDHVVADQPLLAIETDKAVVELPSPRSGHISRLHADPGDIVRVGDILVEFAEGDSPDIGAIVGEIHRAEVVATSSPQPAQAVEAVAVPRVRATPAVRDKARRLEVDLATVVATGTHGTISVADVEAASSAATVAEPLRGVRRAMAANMSRAHAEVVPATVTEEADIGGWLTSEDVTLRLARAIARACSAEPALNVTFHGRDIGRAANTQVHLGVAMDTTDGLFVPVMHDVGRRSKADLRQGLEALKSDVESRSIPPDQLRGQTITLSNFGMFGGRHAALVVVPPQVAIVGAGRIRDAVVAVRGKPEVRPVLPISLTFDHRAVMGGEAARFLSTLVTDLETQS